MMIRHRTTTYAASPSSSSSVVSSPSSTVRLRSWLMMKSEALASAQAARGWRGSSSSSRSMASRTARFHWVATALESSWKVATWEVVVRTRLPPEAVSTLRMVERWRCPSGLAASGASRATALMSRASAAGTRRTLPESPTSSEISPAASYQTTWSRVRMRRTSTSASSAFSSAAPRPPKKEKRFLLSELVMDEKRRFISRDVAALAILSTWLK
mmetsp:Transcript_27717/g.85032  ORF Transcript_27717/g.85032 Transcript_27717/m.85032 type:complete len:214 (-) Transcript_27717:222-863(-)